MGSGAGSGSGGRWRRPDADAEERDEITAVIRGYLIECGESAPAAEVLKATRSAGPVDNAVNKARRRAGVRTERRGYGKGGSWVWTIESAIGANDSLAANEES
ncbi:hypothetical protein M2284_002470 [Rhodococcus sp. LBL1]|nr:hypothetical protein [Rhodococcus sp. LBL1]MDH6683854.1 hypothetical protein [Rhodococcus sp. LBL2]